MGKPLDQAEPTYVQGWKTTDDKIWGSLEDAYFHQHKLNFHTWCCENICVGGSWSADMVAEMILKHWSVEPIIILPPSVTRSSE